MKDREVLKIPQAAFRNAQIIQALQERPSFRQDVRNFVSREYGLQDWPLVNAAYVASLLYCLIVVSRQVFVEGRVEEAFWDHEMSGDQMCAYFNVKKATREELQKSSHFLRRLRNSISHVRYDMIDEGGEWTFVFRDRPPRSEDDDFEVTASLEKLTRFLSEVGAKLANLRDASRVPQ